MSHPVTRILWMLFGVVTAAAGSHAFVTAGESVWMAVALFVASFLTFGLLIPWMLRKRANLFLIFACMLTMGLVPFFASKGGTAIVFGSMYVCLPMIYSVGKQVASEDRASGQS